MTAGSCACGLPDATRGRDHSIVIDRRDGWPGRAFRCRRSSRLGIVRAHARKRPSCSSSDADWWTTRSPWRRRTEGSLRSLGHNRARPPVLPAVKAATPLSRIGRPAGRPRRPAPPSLPSPAGAKAGGSYFVSAWAKKRRVSRERPAHRALQGSCRASSTYSCHRQGKACPRCGIRRPSRPISQAGARAQQFGPRPSVGTPHL
jgi:hypothetical protein